MPGIAKTMKEFGAGKLHSGSKKGPKVTSQKQAVAIGLSEARAEKGKKARPKGGDLIRKAAGKRNG